MAKHGVTFSIPERKLQRADIDFYIKRDGTAFGRFLVSNGAVLWKPKNKQKGYKMSWAKFDQMMQDQGTAE